MKIETFVTVFVNVTFFAMAGGAAVLAKALIMP